MAKILVIEDMDSVVDLLRTLLEREGFEVAVAQDGLEALEAVRRLPEAERRALYARTLRTLEASCAPTERSPGLDDYCREQAEFLLNFPECDVACRALSLKYSGLPTR